MKSKSGLSILFMVFGLVAGYIGTRVTGGSAGRYAIVPQGLQGQLPTGVERLEVSTPLSQF